MPARKLESPFGARNASLPQVVSRVKLPGPGSGQTRVADITAGSGRASSVGSAPRTGESAPSAVGVAKNQFMLAVVPDSPASAPGSTPMRRMTTPPEEVPLSRSLQSRNSFQRSLQRSSLQRSSLQRGEFHRSLLRSASENIVASPVQSFIGSPLSIQQHDEASTPEDLPCAAFELDSGPRADTNPEEVEKTLEEALIEDAPTVLASPAEADTVAPSQPTNGRNGQALMGAPPFPTLPPRQPQSAQRNKGSAAVRGSAQPSHRRDQPRAASRRASASGVLKAHARSQSEPPNAAQLDERGYGGRLPQLLAEVDTHLKSTTTETTDSKGWLQETAQLELFVDELRWLISEHQSKTGVAQMETEAPVGEDLVKSPRVQRQQQQQQNHKRHEVSVLKGDKDLRWARQQLKLHEREHAQLAQAWTSGDREEAMAELRSVEESIDMEQRRQSALSAESRQRERDLARLAKEVEAGEIEQDGNARALQQIARLEAELGVWRVKNTSLEKQVQQTAAQLKKAQANSEAASLRAQRLADELNSEDQLMRLAEQEAREQSRTAEVESLQEVVAELQEARRRAARNNERQIRDKARELSGLKEEQAELEGRLRKIEIEEKDLRRQHRSAIGARLRGIGAGLVSVAASPRVDLAPAVGSVSPRGLVENSPVECRSKLAIPKAPPSPRPALAIGDHEIKEVTLRLPPTIDSVQDVGIDVCQEVECSKNPPNTERSSPSSPAKDGVEGITVESNIDEVASHEPAAVAIQCTARVQQEFRQQRREVEGSPVKALQALRPAGVGAEDRQGGRGGGGGGELSEMAAQQQPLHSSPEDASWVGVPSSLQAVLPAPRTWTFADEETAPVVVGALLQQQQQQQQHQQQQQEQRQHCR